MNCQQIHDVLKTTKTVAVYFNDAKTEGTFSSQDQKLVETTNLWRQFSSDKITTAQIRFWTIANPEKLMIGTLMNSSKLLN